LINDLSDTLNLKSKYGRNANPTININSFSDIKSLKLYVITFERWKWHVFDPTSPKTLLLSYIPFEIYSF